MFLLLTISINYKMILLIIKLYLNSFIYSLINIFYTIVNNIK